MFTAVEIEQLAERIAFYSDPDRTLNLEEAAKFLNVTRRRMYVLMKAGLRSTRIGKGYGFSRGELIRFRESHRS